MAKKSTKRKDERLRRDDPERGAPNRSGSDHVKRHAGSGSGKGGGPGNGGNDGNGGNGKPNRPKSLISDSVQQAISNMVQLSSAVIEEQIRAGQTAAARLRQGMADSQQLNTDVSALVESLVGTTKDVGATWLELISIVVRSLGTKSPCPGDHAASFATPRPVTITRTATSSGGATTMSSVTPADLEIPAEPPQITVTGSGVKNVTLDLRPPSPHFVPMVRELLAGDPRNGLKTVKFQLAPDRTHLVLTVNVPRGLPAGTYTGAIVDSSTNQPGGTVSVTVGN